MRIMEKSLKFQIFCLFCLASIVGLYHSPKNFRKYWEEKKEKFPILKYLILIFHYPLLALAVLPIVEIFIILAAIVLIAIGVLECVGCPIRRL